MPPTTVPAMPAFLAICSALVVGSSDFLGGFAGRKGRIYAVVVWTQFIGFVAIVGISALIGGDPTAADLWWGAGAGLSGSIGIAILYRGFTVAQIGVVSPISSVGAAAVPALFGIFTGEEPGAPALIGVAVGIVAIALVSQSDGTRRASLIGVLHGAGAGIGFAGLFILLSYTTEDAGTWPLVPGRLAGAVVLTIGAIALGKNLKPAQGSWPAIFGAGVLAMAGNGLFLLAVQRGLLSLVAVLTSLYPAASVMWARLVFHERLRRVQLVGFALALIAVGLIVAG